MTTSIIEKKQTAFQESTASVVAFNRRPTLIISFVDAKVRTIQEHPKDPFGGLSVRKLKTPQKFGFN